MSIMGRFKQRYGRFRKRRLFVFLAVFLVIAFLSSMILAALGLFGSRSELCTIRISDDGRTLQSLSGTGINLDYIPLTNFVKDPSFESHNRYSSFHLTDVDGDRILLDMTDVNNASLDISSLSGSNIRIYTIDENGNTILGVKAGVVSYSPANFTLFDEIEDTNFFWTQDPLVKVIVCNNVTSAITTEGSLISDIGSLELSRKTEPERSYFCDISSSDLGAFAVTAAGDVYYSNDGKTFSPFSSFDIDDPYFNELGSGTVKAESVAALNNEAVVLLDNGSAFLCTYKGIFPLDDFPSDVALIANTDDRVYVFLTDGSVYSSSNGLVYSSEKEIDQFTLGRSIFDTSASAGDMAVLLDGGTILMITPEGGRLIEASSGIKDICLSKNNELICLSEAGEASVLIDGSFVSLGFEIENIFSGEEKELFILRGANIYSTSICSSILIDQVIADKTVFAGDTCFLEKSLPACSFIVSGEEGTEDGWTLAEGFDSWDSYGSGTAVSAIDGAPSGLVDKCARILVINDGLHVLSQKVADSGSEIFTEKDFFRIELWLKQSGISDKTVKVWLSSEGCKDTGFVIDNCKSAFTDYSNVFAVSDDLLNSKNEIRLNIAFEGTGELFVDGVYLGFDKYQSSVIPESFAEAVNNSSPNAIRLNNLRIGSNGVSYGSLFSPSINSNSCVFDEEEGAVNSCASLEDSLKLVKESRAYPWLVFGSSVNYESVSSVLEYMCGSLSSPYGKIRIDNGTAVPWSRQFETIIFEINDADGIFASDMQRSSYVNYVIGLIKQSSYYMEIKDNIIFVDGMNYEGGSMLSNADCHCSSYRSEGMIKADITYIDYINSEFLEINAKTPRVSTRGTDTGEYIASFDTEAVFEGRDMTAGECIVTLLSDEATFTGMIMADIDCDRTNRDFENLISDDCQTTLNTLNILNDLKYSKRLNIEVQKPLSEIEPDTLSSFNSNVGTYLFKTDEGLILIIANASDSQQQFLIDAPDLSLSGSIMTRYSASGEELQTEKMSNRRPRYTLQPGQVITVMISAE